MLLATPDGATAPFHQGLHGCARRETADTHALIWWSDGSRLRLCPIALAAIDGPIDSAGRPGGSPGLLVSAISCWDVAMLVKRGRLALSLDLERWLALLVSHPAVRLLALDPAVAVAATLLPEPFHADPADRFLVAQARALGIPLLSADRAGFTPMAPCAACGDGRPGSRSPMERRRWLHGPHLRPLPATAAEALLLQALALQPRRDPQFGAPPEAIDLCLEVGR